MQLQGLHSLNSDQQELNSDGLNSYRVENIHEIALADHTHQQIQRERDAVLVVRKNRIEYVGPRSLMPEEAKKYAVIDANHKAVVPALVDAHTHILYGGTRTNDFSLRAQGKSYDEILRAGGGIWTTVEATRAASNEELETLVIERLKERVRQGIGTTEIKSGYGLSLAEELRHLRLLKKIKNDGSFDIEVSCLALHAIPKDSDRKTYIASVRENLLPIIAEEKLARFMDCFVEGSAYTKEEAFSVLSSAKSLGLYPRLHADQLSYGGGAELAAELGASSADHLEFISDQGIQALKANDTVAILLPIALLHLGLDFRTKDTHTLGKRLLDAGVKIAVATDTNPGSAPSQNLWMAGTFACTRLGLSVEQALYAITQGGANALKRTDIGSLEVGKRARFLILKDKDSRTPIANLGEPDWVLKRIGF